MKTLSVFVAVAIVLTVMCSQQSSAVPVLQGEEQEETIFLEIPGGAMNETVMDFMKVRYGCGIIVLCCQVRCLPSCAVCLVLLPVPAPLLIWI
uniref:Hepcidin n=1 Tax=Gouania willdenowi TaxID=441366 RepID=A0A8C5ETZ4_GOUWI